MTDFALDPRLEDDTLPVATLETCELRLMNDKRWIWLILVPLIEGAEEWHELHTDQRQDIDFEIANVAAVLKGITACEKINIAGIGNMVRQLHIHVIARSSGDTNWPGTVWGVDGKENYAEEDAETLIGAIRHELGVSDDD